MRLVHSILRALRAARGRWAQWWAQHPGPVLLCMTALAAVAMGLLVASPRALRPTYQYDIGDFADATIRAPWDLSIEDEVATSRMRNEAARFAAPVARFDGSPATIVPTRIVEVFSRARDLIARADEQRVVPAEELAKLGAAARRRAKQVSQRDENPHDGMTPADSARIILNHVADGVRLLRQHGVGARIEEFAREHQGTGVLTVFQQKAEAAGYPVNPDDFRYPGPRPRSRETAILMMADKIEATARSVGAKTTEEFRGVVDRTIDALQATGQFDDSPLTLRDLTLVRQAFASALGDVHHTRVAYPPTAPAR